MFAKTTKVLVAALVLAGASTAHATGRANAASPCGCMERGKLGAFRFAHAGWANSE